MRVEVGKTHLTKEQAENRAHNRKVMAGMRQHNERVSAQHIGRIKEVSAAAVDELKTPIDGESQMGDQKLAAYVDDFNREVRQELDRRR